MNRFYKHPNLSQKHCIANTWKLHCSFENPIVSITKRVTDAKQKQATELAKRSFIKLINSLTNKVVDPFYMITLELAVSSPVWFWNQLRFRLGSRFCSVLFSLNIAFALVIIIWKSSEMLPLYWSLSHFYFLVMVVSMTSAKATASSGDELL